jgi:malate synthase
LQLDGGLFPFENQRVGENNNLGILKADLQLSIRVCLNYYFQWLKGVGAFSLDNLMEVASTVDICRVQLWVWMKQRAKISDRDGRNVDLKLIMHQIEKEGQKISTNDKLTLV